jgi:hypothetical protein
MTGLRAVRGPGLIAAGVVLLAGCRAPEVTACTEIGAPSGVNVTVEKRVAAEIRSVRLTICQGSDCQNHLVALAPGADTVDQGCSGTGPDAACSATAVPNGSKVGFVAAELRAGMINISAMVNRTGRQQKLGPIEVEAKVTYPNGINCPAGGNQAKVSIGADGLR